MLHYSPHVMSGLQGDFGRDGRQKTRTQTN